WGKWPIPASGTSCLLQGAEFVVSSNPEGGCIMVVQTMPSRSTGDSPRLRRLRARLVRALPSCGTEADIVQLLYSELRPLFGYDPIALQVLEREGWYHHFAIDHGLLQDVRRRRLSESIFRPNYDQMETVVGYPKPAKLMV